jgi:hypothetical protein
MRSIYEEKNLDNYIIGRRMDYKSVKIRITEDLYYLVIL